MEVDKTFKLHLALSLDIAIADYIWIIDLLNRKDNLLKQEITFWNSHINNDLLIFLFSLDSSTNKIARI
jgi:hypothetical protein